MLINCPECNHEVSDTAKACPYCGFAVADYTERQKKIEQIKEEAAQEAYHNVLAQMEKDKRDAEEQKRLEIQKEKNKEFLSSPEYLQQQSREKKSKTIMAVCVTVAIILAFAFVLRSKNQGPHKLTKKEKESIVNAYRETMTEAETRPSETVPEETIPETEEVAFKNTDEYANLRTFIFNRYKDRTAGLGIIFDDHLNAIIVQATKKMYDNDLKLDLLDDYWLLKDKITDAGYDDVDLYLKIYKSAGDRDLDKPIVIISDGEITYED